MSKSLGNYIGIAEPADEIYGKAMSIPDSLMEEYLRLAIGYSDAEARRLAGDAREGRVHPRDLKARLARELTALYHSVSEASSAEERFNRVHRERLQPEALEEKELPIGPSGRMRLTQALVSAGLAGSMGEARRLIRGGGVSVNGDVVGDEMLELGRGAHEVRAGKRRFLRITLT
jgi:tyrosyl-tRNA synthetase